EKRESGTTIARDRKDRGHGAWPWDRHDGVPRGPRRLDQRLAGIGEGGSAGIAHEGHVVLVERRHDAGRAAPLDRGAVADQRLADAVTRQQPGGDAGVLRGDRANLSEDAHRPGRRVLEVADRGADGDEDAPSQLASQSPTWPAISAEGPTKREAGGSTSTKA